jgi:hypothetical protein
VRPRTNQPLPRNAVEWDEYIADYVADDGTGARQTAAEAILSLVCGPQCARTAGPTTTYSATPPLPSRTFGHG